MKNVVVLGAGVAGLRAVQTLRGKSFQGSVVLVSAEREEPYNLPPLSKELLTGALDEADIRLSTFADLESLNVELMLGARATALDTTASVLHTTRGKIPYDGLIIATGSVPQFPGAWPRLGGVYCLRTLEDARRIRELMARGSTRVVVIGAGFVGCEIACAARHYGLETTIVEAQDYPLGRSLNRVLAEPVVRLHEEHGVRVRCGALVKGLMGGHSVEAVELKDGTRIEADLVVVGIGARPCLDWLDGSVLAVDDGIVTDATLRTSVPNIYAAGDVVRRKADGTAPSARVEHWTNAKEQGALAASNLLDPETAKPHNAIPYVWSDQYGQRLQIVGDAAAGDVRFIAGGPGSETYLAVAVLDGIVVGAVGFGVGKPFQKIRRLVAERARWADVEQFSSPEPVR